MRESFQFSLRENINALSRIAQPKIPESATGGGSDAKAGFWQLLCSNALSVKSECVSVFCSVE
jgi:hypothetical protein